MHGLASNLKIQVTALPLLRRLALALSTLARSSKQSSL
jgi:hypothetical protein